jgi:hypothetical protein
MVEPFACIDGNKSLTQDFTGTIMRVGHQGCHNHDGGTVLVEFQRNGAPTQESPPQSLPVGVLPVCVWSCLWITQLLLLLFLSLNSKRSFLGSRSHTSVTLIICRPAACSTTPPHSTLVLSSAASAGNPSMVPPSSLWPAAVHQKTPVPGELVPEVPMP